MLPETNTLAADPWRLARAENWAGAYRLERGPARGPKPTDSGTGATEHCATVVPFRRQRA